jgi:hypothetical protein
LGNRYLQALLFEQAVSASTTVSRSESGKESKSSACKSRVANNCQAGMLVYIEINRIVMECDPEGIGINPSIDGTSQPNYLGQRDIVWEYLLDRNLIVL